MNLSFVKVDINILGDSKIKIILREKHGDTYFRMWIGILCLAMKSGEPGQLELGDGIPHTPETLSNELNIKLEIIKKGLELFENLKMIEVISENILIKNFEKHQELEKIVKGLDANRERQKRFRENKIAKLNKNDLFNNDVTVTQRLRNADVTPQSKIKSKTKIENKIKSKTKSENPVTPDESCSSNSSTSEIRNEENTFAINPDFENPENVRASIISMFNLYCNLNFSITTKNTDEKAIVSRVVNALNRTIIEKNKAFNIIRNCFKGYDDLEPEKKNTKFLCGAIDGKLLDKEIQDREKKAKNDKESLKQGLENLEAALKDMPEEEEDLSNVL